MTNNKISTQVQKVNKKAPIIVDYTNLVLPKHIDIIKASEGRVIQEFIVEEKHLNPNQNLHGGFIAYLVDVCGAYALSTLNLKKSFVSIDINISYLANAKINDRVRSDAKVDKISQNLAFVSVEVSRLNENGEKVTIALGRHTLFLKNNKANKNKL
ncbi:Thioesterase/thiol ester dehydrase-isomerase [Neoconidiobolus thromboides FSU 785]|nr:Thioesterase/thiol ester dehydrase-isomerase [Neoconidiobolus thromboides FSU 785]